MNTFLLKFSAIICKSKKLLQSFGKKQFWKNSVCYWLWASSSKSTFSLNVDLIHMHTDCPTDDWSILDSEFFKKMVSNINYLLQ